MALPTQTNMHRPILEFAASKEGDVSRAETINHLKERFSLSDSELQETTEGGQRRLNALFGWARQSLMQAELIESTAWGRFNITPRGTKFLEENSEREVTLTTLNRWRREHAQQDSDDENLPTELATATSHPGADTPVLDEVEATPDELIKAVHDKLQDKLRDDLLESLKFVEPHIFERIVVRLLEKIGYGNGKRVGGSGDGGIDGIIERDPLGFEKIGIQAKRYPEKTVSVHVIRDFSTALDLIGASMGVVVTTSTFTKAAEQVAQTVSASDKKFIRLINGEELASLMIQHNFGVVTENTYEVKKLDVNLFSDPDYI